MIKVKHPLEKCNILQQELLAKCPLEDRRYHELMFSVGNASYLYHEQAETYTPTKQDYQEWLEGLPNNIRKDMQKMGFDECKSILSFTRYVMEKNDIGMDEYIRQLVGTEEYTEYQRMIK